MNEAVKLTFAQIAIGTSLSHGFIGSSAAETDDMYRKLRRLA
jgi:hypothetical protein